MLRQNVRITDVLIGDVHGQVASCSVGARRLKELAQLYGSELLELVFTELLEPFRDADPRRARDHSPRHLPLCRLHGH